MFFVTIPYVAHCLNEESATVLAGTNNVINGGTAFGGGIRYQQLSNLSHPEYLGGGGNYDIGIVTILGAFTFIPNKVKKKKCNFSLALY